jgi:hypothetical protein
MTAPAAAEPRIHELGLLSFNLGVPEQPPAVSGIDVSPSAIDGSPCCIRS